MSMRRQLYEWQINRQTNGYPLANPTDGTTFEQIAGIPFSIFTGGIGNNITMPAATTATQFVAIDNMRCSPSFFLSGAGVMAVFNTAASALIGFGFPAVKEDITSSTNLGTGFNINKGPGVLTQVLPAPDGNTGTGTGAQFTIESAAPADPDFLKVRIGSGYKVGDVITWTGATVVASSPIIIGFTPNPGGELEYVVQASDLAAYTPEVKIPFTGSNENPVYTPSATLPELKFQTTHVNPITSIAGPMMFMQLLINTTSYFNETDGTVGPGLPGTASPCPETAACRSTFEFESPVYILPGQQWDVQVTVYNDSRGIIGDSTTTYNYSASDPSLTVTFEDLCCLVQYTLYDGPDALIATKLVEMGIAVRPENVDWYKRQLLEGTI